MVKKLSFVSRECWPSWGLINLYRLKCIRICPFFDIVFKLCYWLAKPRQLLAHSECVVINDVVQIRIMLLKWFSWQRPLTVLWFVSLRGLGMCRWALPKVPKPNFLLLQPLPGSQSMWPDKSWNVSNVDVGSSPPPWTVICKAEFASAAAHSNCLM